MSFPLSPEDQKLLLDFAGPIFQESKGIDSMYFSDMKTKVDGMPDSGIAGGIQQSLERDFAIANAQRRSEHQQVAHTPQQHMMPVPHYYAQMPQYQVPEHRPSPNQESPYEYQTEFDFNKDSVDNRTIYTNNISKSDYGQIIEILTRQTDAMEKLVEYFEKLVNMISKHNE